MLKLGFLKRKYCNAVLRVYKVKQSRNRPGVSQRVPGGLDSQIFEINKIKNHSDMFRIVCDPSSGSIELYLTEIIRSGSLMFVVCLVGIWQRNFEPVVCVCVCVWCVCVCVCTVRRAGNYSMTLPNTNQAHDKHQ